MLILKCPYLGQQVWPVDVTLALKSITDNNGLECQNIAQHVPSTCMCTQQEIQNKG